MTLEKNDIIHLLPGRKFKYLGKRLIPIRRNDGTVVRLGPSGPYHVYRRLFVFEEGDYRVYLTGKQKREFFWGHKEKG